MKQNQVVMRPQDVVILLKLISLNDKEWNQVLLADELEMSQSEISQSLVRSKNAGLIDSSRKNIMRLALFEFIVYGLKYVFPQQPGAITRGIPTAHSAPPLNKIIQSDENYVWPSALGTIKGQSILPLYPKVLKAIKKDEILYELLALVDSIRIGKSREKDLAIKELQNRIVNGK
jgi:hypothetical protein